MPKEKQKEDWPAENPDVTGKKHDDKEIPVNEELLHDELGAE
jgi:hypothetical protein